MSKGFEAAGSQSGEVAQLELDTLTVWELELLLLRDFRRLRDGQRIYVCELVAAMAEQMKRT